MNYYNNRPFLNNIPQAGGIKQGNSQNLLKYLGIVALGVALGYLIKTIVEERKQKSLNNGGDKR